MSLEDLQTQYEARKVAYEGDEARVRPSWPLADLDGVARAGGSSSSGSLVLGEMRERHGTSYLWPGIAWIPRQGENGAEQDFGVLLGHGERKKTAPARPDWAAGASERGRERTQAGPV